MGYYILYIISSFPAYFKFWQPSSTEWLQLVPARIKFDKAQLISQLLKIWQLPQLDFVAGFAARTKFDTCVKFRRAALHSFKVLSLYHFTLLKQKIFLKRGWLDSFDVL